MSKRTLPSTSANNVQSRPVPTFEELDQLSSKELHDRAVHRARRHLDVRFYWEILSAIPTGLEIHNVEMNPGQGAKLIRTAGSVGRLGAREGEWAVIILPSGEMRRVRRACRATIGQIGNLDWINVSIGKAGRSRHMGIRPHTRAKAMNPIDHPLGGGEGRSNGGRHPVSKTGVLSVCQPVMVRGRPA